MRITRFLLVFILVAGVGCKAQTAPASNALQAKLDRQIELTIRSQYNVPPDYNVTLGDRSKSDIIGFDTLPVTFSNGSQKKTTIFLISKDNNTLARLEKFDLTKAPGSGINVLGRPIRGNPKAKVTIVNFDDLECPFCARMHEVLFPATEQHYGDRVRYIYLDFPLVQLHPWAMHAAVDVNCLADQSPTGYWSLVDTLHSQSDEISGARGQQNLAASVKKVDDLTVAQGKRDNVDMGKLQACISKQDESVIRASMKQGDALGVDGTPTLFVNGERATGAISQSMLWTIIDRAIRGVGGVPPPDNNSAPATPPRRPEINGGSMRIESAPETVESEERWEYGTAGSNANPAGRAKPGKMYPGAATLESTRPKGSGDLEWNMPGPSRTGFVLSEWRTD